MKSSTKAQAKIIVAVPGVIAAVITATGIVAAAIIERGGASNVLPQGQRTSVQTIPTNTGTASVPQANITSTSASLPNLIIPGRASDGVNFQAPQNGIYTFTIISGAYSTWPNASSPGYKGWRGIIFVYENRAVEWGMAPDGFTEPIMQNAQLGTWSWEPSQAAATSANYGSGPSFTLSQGDHLIFIPIDQLGSYADNMGEVMLSVSFSS